MVEIRKLPPEDHQSSGLAPEVSELDALRAEFRDLMNFVKGVLAERESVAALSREEIAAEIAAREAKAPPLEPIENERARQLAAWAAEPRVAIFIAPDDNDKRARDDLVARGLPSEFPPRVFSVNSVQLSIPVGKSTTVPQSIADLYEYMLDPWAARGQVAPVTFDVVEARLSRA